MASEAVRAWAINRGFVMARDVLRKRGTKSVLVLTLGELSTLMTAAVETGAEKALDLMSGEMLRLAEMPRCKVCGSPDHHECGT